VLAGVEEVLKRLERILIGHFGVVVVGSPKEKKKLSKGQKIFRAIARKYKFK